VTTGAGSSFPLMRLAAKNNEMKKDGRILSNRHSMEIIRRRVDQLIERVDMNDAPDRLNQLHKMWEKYIGMARDGRSAEAMIEATKIDLIFKAAREDYVVWEQMFHALDLDRKMVESEVKVAKEIHAILTAEDAYDLVAKLLASVIQIVDDPNKLKQIQFEFVRITGDTPIGSEQPIDLEISE